jgi:phenylpropionate dioxygenase-like ring-hydroxylating dioxygenase large terminal subunit
MLKKEVNEYITQTGPNTPMGQLFRRYWLPVLLSKELPSPDCSPVRVEILGEHLIAFKDSNNQLGLIDEFCAHRGVSLWFGRNEDGGLRCPYHGWKYNTLGQCLDVPSEEGNRYEDKIKLKSYPMVEQGGVIWTYMGPIHQTPELPAYEFSTVDLSQTYTSKRRQSSNWLQALEGGIDSSHVSFLHSGSFSRDPLIRGAKGNRYNESDKKPVFQVEKSPGGLYIGVRRNTENDQYYWRITPWLMPNFTMVPPRGDHPIHGHFWVPINDRECWTWSYSYHPTRSLQEQEVQAMHQGAGIHVVVDEHYIPLARADNDYLMDRSAQASGIYYSGVESVGMQDASLQESMGAVQDRSKEHLVSTDNGIIMMRQAILKSAKALAENPDFLPPGVDPLEQQVRSVALIADKHIPFLEVASDALKAIPGRPHKTI